MLVRSLCYDLLFYVWGTCVTVIALPLLLLPVRWTHAGFKLWAQGSCFLMRYVLGLKENCTGTWPDEPFIVASKHESMWETIALITYLKHPAFILKHSLFYIPLVGQYLHKMCMIWVNRSARKNARALQAQAHKAVRQQRTLIIFPEGRRANTTEKPPLKSGVWYIARHLDIPVVPVAHNAGTFWPRRTWYKRAGTIHMHIGSPLYPGEHTKETFLKALHTAINHTS